MPKYKLADYRYGREEMLALYVKESKVGVGGRGVWPSCPLGLGRWRGPRSM